MNLIGLDIGEKTGFCGFGLDDVLNINKVELAELTVSKLDEFFVYSLARNIEDAVISFNPGFVIIEGYAYGGKGFFNVMQAELTGQVKRMMVDNYIPFYEVPISTMRAAVLNNGRANKSDAKKFAQEFFKCNGLKLLSSNEYHLTDSVIPAVLGWMFLHNKFDSELQQRIANSIVGGSNESCLCGILERSRAGYPGCVSEP